MASAPAWGDVPSLWRCWRWTKRFGTWSRSAATRTGRCARQLLLGRPDQPDRLGSLVRAVQGCTEGARRYRMPFISGKDSLFNEFDGEAIPGTLLISALGLVPDLHRAINSAGMQPGDICGLLGRIKGHSVARLPLSSRSAPDMPPPAGRPPASLPGRAPITSGLINAAHDCSDGGVAVTLAGPIAARQGVSAAVPATASIRSPPCSTRPWATRAGCFASTA